MIRAKENYLKIERDKWVLEWPGQTILCISQLYWTADVTSAFSKAPEGLKDYIDVCNQQLNQIIHLVRGKLSKQNRTTLGIYLYI